MSKIIYRGVPYPKGLAKKEKKSSSRVYRGVPYTK